MQDKTVSSLKPGLPIRQFFPIFQGRNLHYLDTAASAQKPESVIKRVSDYMSYEHANIHRGAYALSANATDNYDLAKRKIAAFIGAKSENRLIFTKGATEGINLVANAYADNFQEGDTILLTLLEHHSNIVPWQLLAERKKLKIVFADITENAELDLKDFKEKLALHRPKLVACTYVANSFGTVTPIHEIIAESRKVGAKILVDAAQSVQHIKMEVEKLTPDFMVFSGHKLYGPTGIGVLYVREGLEEGMKPYQGGGDMISYVSIEGSTWADFPQKFEAGTPPIAEAIGLGAAVEFLESVGLQAIKEYEQKLFEQAWELMSKHSEVQLYGPAVTGGAQSGKQTSIISFNLNGVHAHDLSTVVDDFGVQIRAGHHCAMPALKRLGVQSSARASIGVYSDISDFEALIEGLNKASKLFNRSG